MALLVVVAVVVAVIAATTAVEAHDDPDLDRVSEDGSRNPAYELYVDRDTRTTDLADDWVRVAPGDTATAWVRGNDALRFDACPHGDDLEPCRNGTDGDPPSPPSRERAGGTCGAAVEYEKGLRADVVLGHHFVIHSCTVVGRLHNSRIHPLRDTDTAVAKADSYYATATTGPGGIIKAAGEVGDPGYDPSGVIMVEGHQLGEATYEYCLTTQPYPCSSWARLAILVEPDGWEDARVYGAADEYRLELNWETRLAELFVGAETDEEAEPISRTCCLNSLGFWSVDVRLRVIENDRVKFYDVDDQENGDMACLPRYCDGMRPGNPTLATTNGGWDVDYQLDDVGLRLHGDSVVARVSARTEDFTLPAEARITYCVQYGSNGCGDNNGVTSCARSTYRDAPNENEPDWVTRLPASAYRASDLCPSPATVVLTVEDVTPTDFDKDDDFDPDAEIDEEILKLLRPDEQTDLPPSSGVLYRPDPSLDDSMPLPTTSHTALPLWCYPGITHIGPEHFFNTYDTVKNTAKLWVQSMYSSLWPDAGVTPSGVSPNANQVLLSLLDNIQGTENVASLGWDDLSVLVDKNANPDTAVDLGWAHLRTLEQSSELKDNLGNPILDNLGNPILVLENADELVEKLLVRFYEVARQAHWDGPEPWNGLVTSDYKRYLGQIEWDDQPFLPPGRPLVDTRREAEERTCLGADLQIVRASGAHPGPFWDPRHNLQDPLHDPNLSPAVWPHGLCGIGDDPGVSTDDPEGSKWAYFDPQCPVDPRTKLDPADPLFVALDPADPRTTHVSLAELWVEWPDPRDHNKPWTLGQAWEEALEDPRIRCADESCGNWAPPIAGFYLVRFRIDKPADPPKPDSDPDGEYVSPWHEAWLRAQDVDVAAPDCWDKLDQAGDPSDCARPTTDDRLPLHFDDLVWVSPLGLTGLR